MISHITEEICFQSFRSSQVFTQTAQGPELVHDCSLSTQPYTDVLELHINEEVCIWPALLQIILPMTLI